MVSDYYSQLCYDKSFFFFQRRLFLACSSLCCSAIAHPQAWTHTLFKDLPWRCSPKWSLALPGTSKEYVLKEWLQEGALEVGVLISWLLLNNTGCQIKNTLSRRIGLLESIPETDNWGMQKKDTNRENLNTSLCICKQRVPGKGKKTT